MSHRPTAHLIDALSSASIDQTAYTQPALFAVEYALYEMWRGWGIEADAVLGHSVGEYVAACVAGVFSLEDALTLIALRGRLMQALSAGGGMAAVLCDEARVRAALQQHGTVSIAAVNGPDNVVISGPQAAVQSVVAALEAEGVGARSLTVSHAFHSALMEPMLREFEQAARRVAYAPPRIVLISNVTAGSRCRARTHRTRTTGAATFEGRSGLPTACAAFMSLATGCSSRPARRRRCWPWAVAS